MTYYISGPMSGIDGMQPASVRPGGGSCSTKQGHEPDHTIRSYQRAHEPDTYRKQLTTRSGGDLWRGRRALHARGLGPEPRRDRRARGRRGAQSPDRHTRGTCEPRADLIPTHVNDPGRGKRRINARAAISHGRGMTAPFPWYGGKRRWADRILESRFGHDRCLQRAVRRLAGRPARQRPAQARGRVRHGRRDL